MILELAPGVMGFQFTEWYGDDLVTIDGPLSSLCAIRAKAPDSTNVTEVHSVTEVTGMDDHE